MNLNAATTTPDLVASTAAGLISQAQFDEGAAQWAAVAAASAGTELAACFLDPKGNRLQYVSFPMDSVVGLVSAVGVRQIKARFLLVPDSQGGGLRFTVALYAAGPEPNGERLSAYYLANESSQTAAAPTVGSPVPHELAAGWLSNWTAAPAIKPAMFATVENGPLLGYNFAIEDFVKPLFGSQPFEGLELRLGLGLHEYYRVDNESEPTRTFGLVTRLYHAQSSSLVIDETFFDMATPCPPGH